MKKHEILARLVALLLKMVKPETLLEAWDRLVEFLELKVEETDTPIDDLIFDALKDLDPELYKLAADKVLDVIEDAVEDTGSQVDDIIVLPLIAMIRLTFCIEDDDE